MHSFRIHHIITLIIVLLSALIWAQSDYYAANKTLTEDGYYGLTVTHNLAQGKGLTIDGEQWTNGFQPLFTVLSVPAFWLAGDDLFSALQGVGAIYWLLLIGTALLLGGIAKDLVVVQNDTLTKERYWLTIILYMGGINTYFEHTNGMETGLLLFLYAALLRWYQLMDQNRVSSWLILGLLGGIVTLARIDAAIVVMLFGVWQLWGKNRGGKATPLLRFSLVGFGSLLVSSPWWLYNKIGFGSFMPISGMAQTERGWSLSRAEEMLHAIGQDILPWLWLVHRDTTSIAWGRTVISICLLAFGGWWWAKKSWPRVGHSSNSQRHQGWQGLLLLAVGMALLALWYTYSSFATWFYHRYLSPLTLIATILMALAIVHTLPSKNWRLFLVVLLIMPQIGWSSYALITGKPKQEALVQAELSSPTLKLANTHVPPGEKLAAAQSGMLGFFRNHVVNMDGKVNPSIQPYRNGGENRYLQERGIRWFVDHSTYVEKYLGPDPSQQGWRAVDQIGGFILYKHP
ncbi:MAG: glycosyltransferase family 39 protein [Magnetococcales bacterium]|nr:glycosyltransferase family 39 protein [Magnetococcales bacterium]